MEDKPVICIYHGKCADGFAGAWVLRKYFGEADVEFIPGRYQEPMPDCVAGRDVVLVDFSFPRTETENLVKRANSVTILDHHSTAVARLGDMLEKGEIRGIFDQERSGCMIAWQYYFTEQEPPALMWHIQDRDLWRFELPGTREIQAAVFSYPYDFEIWDELMGMAVDQLWEQGRHIERKYMKDVRELIEVGRKQMTIGGYTVPAINVPYTMGSDAANILAQEAPDLFAAYYCDNAKGHRYVGLRSAKDTGMDVSKIAALYGGGGHKHAAGFEVEMREGHLLEVVGNSDHRWG